MNKAQLQQDIDNMKQKLADIEKELNKPESKGGFKDGDKYWSVTGYGSVERYKWDNCLDTNQRLAMGNVFHTEAEAIQARDKQLAKVRILNKLRELEGYWVADWNDRNTEKFFVQYDYQFKRFQLNFWYALQVLPAEFISTKESWQYVIDNMEADLRLVWGVN